MRPYMALLQGFKDESAPRAKRRKLDHKRSSQPPADSTLLNESGEDEPEDGDQDVDKVEEPENPAIDLDEEPEDDSSDEEGHSTDPFDVHFAHADEQLSSKRVQAAKKGEWTTKRALVQPWRATLMYPGASGDFEPLSEASSLDSFRLKQKLKETAGKKMSNLSEVEKSLGPLLFGYHDILYCDRTVKNSQSLRQLVCLHALNHVFK